MTKTKLIVGTALVLIFSVAAAWEPMIFRFFITAILFWMLANSESMEGALHQLLRSYVVVNSNSSDPSQLEKAIAEKIARQEKKGEKNPIGFYSDNIKDVEKEDANV